MNEAPLGKAGQDVVKLQVRDRITSAPPIAEDSRRPRHANGVGHADSGTLIHPDTLGGVYRSATDINVPSATELWSLLHLERAKAVAQSEGRYKGRRVAFTLDDLERHLTGEITLAFTALHYKRALFVALDVDAFFRELLPEIGKAARAIGGEDLAAAIFCTSGSDAGRGKLIVAFTEPVAARDARKLAQYLCRRARASQFAQNLQRNELTAYPTEKSGGVVRVLGRNAGRDGSIELVFSLDAEPGLSHLRPITPAKIVQFVARLGESIAPWAKRLIETPWRRSEGTNRHFGHMIALAREALRVYARAGGKTTYDLWLNRIKANSPELSLASIKTGDRRNVIDHSRERAWAFACRNPNSWRPIDLALRKGVPRGAARVYLALLSYVANKGLRPESFAIDYERIAALVDSSKSTAHRWVQVAVKYGYLVVLEQGTKHSKGKRGRCTRLSLTIHSA
jgi:hypothetical protein